MSLFENLAWSTEDVRKLFVEVRKCTGKWSTENKPVIDLRDRLLVLQRYRCAYCQYPITANLVGYRELDHILPKEGNSNHTDSKKNSDLEDDRYVTHGYPQFKYEPKNLALICKPCNSSKGTYDSLLSRATGKAPIRYPRESRFMCFHPHYHNYSAHIAIDENFFYKHLTERGRVLLKICGLMKVENIEKKFAPAARKVTIPGRDLYSVVRSLTMQLEERNFGLGHAIDALITNRKLSNIDARKIISQCSKCVTQQDLDLLKRACEALENPATGLNRSTLPNPLKKAFK